MRLSASGWAAPEGESLETGRERRPIELRESIPTARYRGSAGNLHRSHPEREASARGIPRILWLLRVCSPTTGQPRAPSPCRSPQLTPGPPPGTAAPIRCANPADPWKSGHREGDAHRIPARSSHCIAAGPGGCGSKWAPGTAPQSPARTSVPYAECPAPAFRLRLERNAAPALMRCGRGPSARPGAFQASGLHPYPGSAINAWPCRWAPRASVSCLGSSAPKLQSLPQLRPPARTACGGRKRAELRPAPLPRAQTASRSGALAASPAALRLGRRDKRSSLQPGVPAGSCSGSCVLCPPSTPTPKQKARPHPPPHVQQRGQTRAAPLRAPWRQFRPT